MVEQKISFIEDGISCKNMYVFCPKYDLFWLETLCKYEIWTYYLKIKAVWKSPVLLLRPLQNVGMDSFRCQTKQWIINLNDTLIVMNMQGILEISILFIQLKDMQVFLYVKLKPWKFQWSVKKETKVLTLYVCQMFQLLL